MLHAENRNDANPSSDRGLLCGRLFAGGREMMRVSLIGATGNAGSRILAELARRAHRVTAIVRHPERVPRFDGVIARECDANRADDLEQIRTDRKIVLDS